MNIHTPINLAESVFEPFWDPLLSGFPQWELTVGEQSGLRMEQRWCWLYFEWSRKPAAGPVFALTRERTIDCAGYDSLIVSFMAPEGAKLHVTVRTDRGEIRYEDAPFGLQKREIFVPLGPARTLLSLTLELHMSGEGAYSGWFNWLGLRNTPLAARYREQWRRFDENWDGYLKPENYEPEFRPTTGFIADAAELEQLRAEHAAFVTRHGTSPFAELAKDALALVPEAMIGEYVNFWNDTRYNREQDYDKLLLIHGPNAAVAGLLLQDKRLTRLAARYAMSIAMCGRWDGSFCSYFPGSVWEHRSFVQSLCVYETALILDLAGEWFTDLGRELIERKIAEEGIGNINFNVWKHEYIHHCNQLLWFTPGRVLGYLLLERTMPRVEPYLELAMSDMLRSLEKSILPDGGYVEGPTYFAWTARQAGVALYQYARMKNRDFRGLAPDILLRTAAFADALLSTDDRLPMILICDAANVHQEAAALLAYLMPDSQWVTIYRKLVRERGGLPDTLLAHRLDRDIPQQGPAPLTFNELPGMGVLSSVREWQGAQVKLFIMGNSAGAGHTHEDKGSFVLEFAGDSFALDFGMCDYSNPLAETLTNAQRHNMLVPYGTDERPKPDNPLDVDVKPRGRGDSRSFVADIDASPGWEPYYRRWTRQWRSTSPDNLVIVDEYELAQGDGVDFLWTTQLPMEIKDGRIVISGRRGSVCLEIPSGCEARIDELPLINEEYQAINDRRRDAASGSLRLGKRQRVAAIRRAGTSGRLEVRVTLQLSPTV